MSDVAQQQGLIEFAHLHCHTRYSIQDAMPNHKAYVDAIYYCPHHPDKGFDGEVKELKIVCECRKRDCR